MATPRKSGTQRGGRKKPPGKAQGHRKNNVVELAVVQGGCDTRATVDKSKVPAPPVDLGETAAAVWETFWASPLSAQVEVSDQFALHRWIRAVEELEQHLATIAETGVTVKGSTGQVRMHPLYSRVEKLEEQIGKFEQQFGMTPLARVKLGLAIGEGALTAEKLNQIAKERSKHASQDKAATAGKAQSKTEAEPDEAIDAEVVEAELVEGYEPA